MLGGKQPAFRLIALAVALVALAVFAFGFLISISLPYGDWDAMAYGAWSRLIADNWPHIRFATASAVDYHRPFFYALQGTLWRIFGFHQSLGRLLSLGFSALLAASLGFLAWRSAPRRYAEVSAAIGVALVFVLASFERFIASGLTDIPVAAMLALTAALLYVRRLGRAQLPLVGLAACLSLLTKPSAVTALAGLTLAVLVGPRADLRRRLPAAGALAGGTAVALVYDLVQARYVHMGLRAFMTEGTDGFYASLSTNLRHDVLLSSSWLGSDLRLLLTFAVVYALVRLVPRSTHRIAVGAALIAGFVWSWLGPHLASGGGDLVPGTGRSLHQVAVVVLVASLGFSFVTPADAVPDRLELARLLVWVTPPFVVWAWFGVYDDRLASPVWPPLLLLMVRALVPAFAGAAARRQVLVAFPAAALLVIAGYSTEGMNGLGSAGWRSLTDSLGDAASLRSLALGGDFATELDALRPVVKPGDTIVTLDARLPFYYSSQVSLFEPQGCAQLQQPKGRTLFLLLESDEERAIYGDKAGSQYWENCHAPTLTKVTERPGAFALFTVAACGAATAVPGLAVEFGRFDTDAAAEKQLKFVQGLGFGQAVVEQLGCKSWRIVEHGIPSKAVGESILAEAKSAHLHATLVGG